MEAIIDGMGVLPMNWKSGLFRVWVILTVCWAAPQTWHEWSDIKGARGGGIPTIYQNAQDYWIATGERILLPPVLLLLLGFAMAWIALGFRSSAAPER